MDPQDFPVVVPLYGMIDELCKIFANGKASACALPSESQTINENSDIGVLKATKAELKKKLDMMHNDWMKAMETFHAVQEYILSLCLMANPTNPNLIPPRNVGTSYLPVLLMKMKEELGQRISEEKASRLAQSTISTHVPEVADESADADALKSEITALRSTLEALGSNWQNMSAAFVAFVKNLVDIGIIMAPNGGSYPSHG